MSNGTHIRAIGEGSEGEAPVDAADAVVSEDSMVAEEVLPAWDEALDEPVHRRRIWPIVFGTLAILAVLGWTAFFTWTNRDAMLAGAPPAQWIGWVTQWAVPVLLVAVAWLIAMRSSTREAARFGDAARVLARESATLEARLVTVNRELSLAR